MWRYLWRMADEDAPLFRGCSAKAERDRQTRSTGEDQVPSGVDHPTTFNGVT